MTFAACNGPGQKIQNPPVLRRVGPETFSYPHAGARIQQQVQHGVEQVRMEIGYAGQREPSNVFGSSSQDISLSETRHTAVEERRLS